MNTQIKTKALEAENARLRKHLKEIKSMIDAPEVKEQINNGPVRILVGLEDKAARLEHIENTFFYDFDQDDDQDPGAPDRSNIN